MADTPNGAERFLNKRQATYTLVSNALLRDSRLSLKAKGLLAVMLSVPDGRTYSMKQVESVSDDGRDAHRSAMRELEAAGYVTRRQTRSEGGKLGEAEYSVTDDTRTVDGFSGDGKPGDGKPVHGKPVKARRQDSKAPLEIPPALLAHGGWEEAWGAWIAYRRERRLPGAQSTFKRQLAFLAQQPDPVACIEQSITNGWNGLFEVRQGGRDANARAVSTAQNTYRALTQGDTHDPF